MNNEWQPIETAPHDETEVLVCRTYGGLTKYSVALFYKDSGEWCDTCGYGWAGMDGFNNQPTHWMPLPVPPK